MTQFCRTLLAVTACCLLAGCASTRSADQLMQLYQQYHDARDIDGIMSLYYTEGTPGEFIKALRSIEESYLDGTIAGAHVSPIPPEARQKAVQGEPFGAITIVPNLSATNQLVIKWKKCPHVKPTSYSSASWIGVKGKKYYFVSGKPKTEPAVPGRFQDGRGPQSPEKQDTPRQGLTLIPSTD